MIAALWKPRRLHVRARPSSGAVETAELLSLTPLRGIAALAVLLYHTEYLAFNHAGGQPPMIFKQGDLAVDLFFFLSGFVLAHVYGRRLAEDQSWRLVRQFLWMRLCRIYPASFFTIAVFVLMYAIGTLNVPASVSFEQQAIATLLLMQVPWLQEIAVNGPSWSISAEWYAYLLFPFLAPAIWRLRVAAIATAGTTLLAAVVVEQTIDGIRGQHQTTGWGALLRALPEFAIGAVAYRFYSDGLFRGLWEKDLTFVGIVVLILAVGQLPASEGAIAGLLLALLLASVSNSGRVAGILNLAPLRWLGEISYSLYIFQLLPLALAVGVAKVVTEPGLGPAWFQVLAVSLAVAGGALVHRCVDVPVRSALRALPGRLTALWSAKKLIPDMSPVPADRVPLLRTLRAATGFVRERSNENE